MDNAQTLCLPSGPLDFQSTYGLIISWIFLIVNIFVRSFLFLSVVHNFSTGGDCLNVDLFVENVKGRCKLLNVSPTIACIESGLSRSFLTDIKKGRSPTVGNIEKLAIRLGTSVSDLLGETKDSPTTDVSSSDTGIIPEELRHLVAAYQDAGSEIQAAVRRVLGID